MSEHGTTKPVETTEAKEQVGVESAPAGEAVTASGSSSPEIKSIETEGEEHPSEVAAEPSAPESAEASSPNAEASSDTQDTDDGDGVFLPEEELAPTIAPVAATDDGHLEEQTLPSEPSGPPQIHTLERGEYTVIGRDSVGRSLAKGPDGQEVLIAAYQGGLTLTRGLYPHPMLPDILDSAAATAEIALVAHPKPEGITLEMAMVEHDLSALLTGMVDLARFNRYVVARGFALVGLELRDVLLEPTRFARLPVLRRIGETPPAEAPRYVAPERAAGQTVRGDEGSYTLGAMIYHALEGRQLTEGEMPTDFPERPGVPQALSALLSPPPGRASPSEALELVDKLADNLRPRRRWVIGAASSVGINPDRQVNEDSAGWRYGLTFGNAGRETRLMACVADGMGGMARGEVASQSAVEAFLGLEFEADLTLEAARGRVNRTNARVWDALEGKAGGCTFTGIVAEGPKAFIGHVGDTRAYLASPARTVFNAPSFDDFDPLATHLETSMGGHIQQITEDHSMVQMLVKMGVIAPEDAHGHPDSNKVTRALGSSRDLGPDYVDGFEVRAKPGDRIAIMSDGVWGALEPEFLRELLLDAVPAQDLADKLVRAALVAGSSDNATALVLEYEERDAL